MSMWAGAAQGLMQALAAQELRKRQLLLDSLNMRDKQESWAAEKVRARQADRGLDLTEKNQGLLRRQAEIQQNMLDEERERDFALNVYKTQVPTENAGRKAYEILERRGLGGVIEKRPGQVLRLGAESNVGPIETPGGAIAAGRDVQKDETFPSRGGADWQAARQKAQEQAQSDLAQDMLRYADRAEQRGWQEGQNEQQRDLMRELASIRAAAAAGANAPNANLIEAVIKHPEIYPTLTKKTQEGLIKSGALNEGFEGFGIPLTDSAMKEFSNMADGMSASTQLDLLLKQPGVEKLVGAYWEGTIKAAQPNSPARRLQGAYGQVRQSVGKLMEGGVLREYDEKKYLSMLPNENDELPDQMFKLNWMRAQMRKEWDTFLAIQRAGGRNVNQMENLQVPQQPVPDLKTGNISPPVVPPGMPRTAAPGGPPPGSVIWEIDPATGKMVKRQM